MSDYIELPSVGEILREEFMEPLGISAYRLAKDIGVSVSRIQDILNGTRKVTVDTSLRLAKYFGVSDRYFLNIQNDIDIRKLKHKNEKDLNDIKPFKIAIL
jgi:addiction module HigA family antidote